MRGSGARSKASEARMSNTTELVKMLRSAAEEVKRWPKWFRREMGEVERRPSDADLLSAAAIQASLNALSDPANPEHEAFARTCRERAAELRAREGR